ncbi:MAG TPA: methyltransferase [Solirubrobacteraceae bacterium]|nr:methyltransferase [Solirubrobacteraceae bacterium]
MAPAPGTDPRSRLLRLLDGFLVTQLVFVAAELGVADVLAGGPRTGADVAEAVGADPAALTRVLRGLASEEVLAEDDAGRFSLTPLGEALREDRPGSWRGAARLRGGIYYRATGGLLAAVREGGSAFERAFGASFFDHLAAEPATEAAFNAGMAARSAREASDVVAAYDFADAGTLVDVGGGSGMLLSAILRAAPGVSGVLLDRPAAIAAAAERFTADGLDGRARCEAGDFFAAVPAGADTYLLSRVLHDWGDEDASRILAVCRRAAGPGARLLVVEALLPERAVDAPEVIRMDLLMLVLVGGAERTAAQYRALLAGAGFAVTRVVPTPSPSGVSVIEAVATTLEAS